jgi:hypothetical protein
MRWAPLAYTIGALSVATTLFLSSWGSEAEVLR